MVVCPLPFGKMRPGDRRLPRSSRDSYPRVGSMMMGSWSRGGDYQPPRLPSYLYMHAMHTCTCSCAHKRALRPKWLERLKATLLRVSPNTCHDSDPSPVAPSNLPLTRPFTEKQVPINIAPDPGSSRVEVKSQAGHAVNSGPPQSPHS